MAAPIVVIGSGMAGYFFAREFRALNKDRPLKMITMTDGRFYSKPLLSTALTHQKTIEALALSAADAMSEKLAMEVVTEATVTAIDVSKKMITYQTQQGEQQQAYSDLVLACGAEKIMPSLQGDAVADLHSVNNIEDYAAFRDWICNKKHIAILGAGLVGCEFANDLVNADYEVTVIAQESYPLARFVPEKIGLAVQQALAERGVQWRMQALAKCFDHDSAGYRLTLDSGETILSDGVMSAVGLRPHLSLAKSAGLDVNQGVIVDAQLRTSDSAVYALGDCAEVMGECRQYVASLLQCARALAKVLSGLDFSLQYPIMPIVIKTPACPVVLVPPNGDAPGEWVYEGDGCHLMALYKDGNDQLHGFALTGDKVREKVGLVKQLERGFYA
ncbi:MAG: FAD-dependent oxidoreductase [Coxiellaceae bacterium]|nr:FAD-dependent oxidoreductase [Coxiellaceae bacterium]